MTQRTTVQQKTLTADFARVSALVVVDEVQMALQRALVLVLQVAQVALEHGLHAVRLQMLVQLRLHRKHLPAERAYAHVLLWAIKSLVMLWHCQATYDMCTENSPNGGLVVRSKQTSHRTLVWRRPWCCHMARLLNFLPHSVHSYLGSVACDSMCVRRILLERKMWLHTCRETNGDSSSLSSNVFALLRILVSVLSTRRPTARVPLLNWFEMRSYFFDAS